MSPLRLVPLLCALALLVLPASASAARADVAALQLGLSASGFSPGPIDGVTGPRTRAAVRALQRRRRLAVDGIAGPRTRRALGRRGRPSFGSRPMRLGHAGWDVAALQFLLGRRGFGPGAVDGGFGPATASAVRRFQRAAGVAVDGVAGPATISSLRRPRVNAVPVSAPTGPVRFLRPVRGHITDGFGWVGGRRHTGVDFPRDSGTAVRAAGRGVVVFAGRNTGGYGNLVVIAHRLGFESWYAHLSVIHARRGQPVVGGTQIGLVGSTGRSTGPHLHFEVRRFSTPIDPLPRLLAIAARTRGRRLRCRPNGDARTSRDADPPRARPGRCP